MSILESQQSTIDSQFSICSQTIRLELFQKILKLTFLTPKDEKSSIPLYLRLDYEVKAAELTQKMNASIVKNVGFSIFEDHAITYDFYCSQEEMISRWIKELSKHIFLTGFLNDFKTLKYVGRGQFAKVWEVERIKDGNKFAAKIIDKELCYGEVNGRQAVYNEIQILKKLNHPNIVHLECIYESEKSLYIVLEYIQGFSFSDLTRKKKSKSETESSETVQKNRNVNIMKNLLKAVKYLHDHGIAHRDLKPGNIIINPHNNWMPYIIDFGLSEFTSKEQFLFQCCGSPGYMAPQIFTNFNARDLQKSDIFSLGAIFYMLLTREPLFDGNSTEEIIEQTQKSKNFINRKIKSSLHEPEASLLLKMLQQNPKKRLTADQALSHDFFLEASYDYLKEIRKPISEGQATSKYSIQQGNFPSKFEELFSESVVFMGHKLNLMNEEEKQNINVSQNPSMNMVEPSQGFIEKIQRRSSRYMSQESIEVNMKREEKPTTMGWSGKWKNFKTLEQIFMSTNFWHPKDFNITA